MSSYEYQSKEHVTVLKHLYKFDAQRLISEGLMQASGLAKVDASRADGRWAKTYVGSIIMEMTKDLLAVRQ